MGMTYHIIGAGISGLAAAQRLKRQHPGCKVVIYEAANHPGGRIFSFYDRRLGVEIDNATHVILGANPLACSRLKAEDFHKKCTFYDLEKQKLSRQVWKFGAEIVKAASNTDPQQTAPSIKRTLWRKLFPFTPGKRKIYYSHGDLSQKLIMPLLHYADEIYFGWTLKAAEQSNQRVNALVFNRGRRVELGTEDQVISAVDAHNAARLFSLPAYEFNEITNIFYLTSQPLYLPGNNKFLGLRGGMADWVFVNGNIVSVTVSNSAFLPKDKDELARRTWLELGKIRGMVPAFMPKYRVIRHKRATIRQDEANNRNRGAAAGLPLKNLKIIGDWTETNFPACIEAALRSARRV